MTEMFESANKKNKKELSIFDISYISDQAKNENFLGVFRFLHKNFYSFCLPGWG